MGKYYFKQITLFFLLLSSLACSSSSSNNEEAIYEEIISVNPRGYQGAYTLEYQVNLIGRERDSVKRIYYGGTMPAKEIEIRVNSLKDNSLERFYLCGDNVVWNKVARKYLIDKHSLLVQFHSIKIDLTAKPISYFYSDMFDKMEDINRESIPIYGIFLISVNDTSIYDGMIKEGIINKYVLYDRESQTKSFYYYDVNRCFFPKMEVVYERNDEIQRERNVFKAQKISKELFYKIWKSIEHIEEPAYEFGDSIYTPTGEVLSDIDGKIWD